MKRPDGHLRGVAFLRAHHPSNRTRRIVAGRQHHAEDEVVEGERFARAEPDLGGVQLDEVGLGRDDLVVRRCFLDRLDGREDLGEAGRRNLVVGTSLGEDLAGFGVDDDVVLGHDVEIGVVLGSHRLR
jgi:hypothetical protein